METMSLVPIAPDPHSRSETARDDFFEESLTKETVAQCLAGASPVTHPRYKDRMLRLLEIARIVLHDFGLNRNDAYDILVTFNQSHERGSTLRQIRLGQLARQEAHHDE